MSDIRRNADRNRAIQAMMTDGEQLKTFYRFVANAYRIARRLSDRNRATERERMLFF